MIIIAERIITNGCERRVLKLVGAFRDIGKKLGWYGKRVGIFLRESKRLYFPHFLLLYLYVTFLKIYMKYLSFLVLLFALTACSKAEVSPTQTGTTTPQTATGTATQDMSGMSAQDMAAMTGASMTGAMEHQEPLTNSGTGSSEYTMFFKNTNTEKVTLHHTAGKETKVYFINDGAKKMKVHLALPENGNLRLSQIVAPDGTADGPFGVDTDYDLTQNGGYQLLFHENMMAGDPWSGDVEIQVTLSK